MARTKKRLLHGVAYVNGVKCMEMYEDGSGLIYHASEEQRNAWTQKLINETIKPYIENNNDVAEELIRCGVLKPVIKKEVAV